MNKKTLTPVILAGIFFLMLGLSFAAVPLYDLFCRVTGFGGTTQNATIKEIPKIIVDQNYKIRRFNTWKPIRRIQKARYLKKIIHTNKVETIFADSWN